jgi:dTDP-4-dehydrorhamnose reductase
VTRYLVTGASGLLGLNLSLWLSRKNEVVGVIHAPELKAVDFPVHVTDLSAPGEPQRIIELVKPDFIIHTAAMAIVDECQRQPERARRVNAELPAEVARIAARKGIPLIHISTDAVFDGSKGDYDENDEPHPLSIYAETKLQAERNVLREDPQAIVARVNFYGWSLRGTRSLAEFFFSNLSAGTAVKGFSDVFFCSLHVIDLCEILIKMFKKGVQGIYHTVSRECVSKYEFGRRLARQFGFDEKLVLAVSVEEGGLLAARSPNLCLNVSKLQKALGETLPDQAGGLQRFHASFLSGYRQELQSHLAAG